MKRIHTFILIIITAMFFSMCEHEVIEPADPPSVPNDSCQDGIVYFGRDVLPIFLSNCAMCHSVDFAEDDILLDSYENIFASAGDKIVKGNSEESDLFEIITNTDPDDTTDVMPPLGNPPLSPEEIYIIELWIDQGAKDLTCIECDSFRTFYGEVAPIIFKHCQGCHNDGDSYLLSKNLSFFPSPTYSSDDIYYEKVKLWGGAMRQDQSILLGTLLWEDGFLNMPQTAQSPISDCEINVISDWIDAGMPQ